MSEPLTIWVVEDAKLHATEAFRTLKEIDETAHELGLEVTPLWTMDFSWPPFSSLRRSVDLSPDALSNSVDYPDIVILDLMNETRHGNKLEADGFYTQLRKWERHRETHNPSFVVLWSIYQTERAASPFVTKVSATDQRVILLATKQPALLKTRVVDLMRRIKEERENC